MIFQVTIKSVNILVGIGNGQVVDRLTDRSVLKGNVGKGIFYMAMHNQYRCCIELYLFLQFQEIKDIYSLLELLSSFFFPVFVKSLWLSE